MIKTSFTVGYKHKGFRTVVLGVTSIVPNLNGFLFFTEDGENHFIESHELNDGYWLPHVYFEYNNEEDIEVYRKRAEDGNILLLDHRKK